MTVYLPANIPQDFRPIRWPDVEWVPVAALKPNPTNARTHSHKQIKKIRRSLRICPSSKCPDTKAN
jgi:hypothetical protein